jgi:hypothetical protein
MKKLTSVHDEYEVRERLKKTKLHLNAHINLAAALMEPKPWVGLTKEELQTIFNYEPNDIKHIAFLVESLCKEKNGG